MASFGTIRFQVQKGTRPPVAGLKSKRTTSLGSEVRAMIQHHGAQHGMHSIPFSHRQTSSRAAKLFITPLSGALKYLLYSGLPLFFTQGVYLDTDDAGLFLAFSFLKVG